MFRPAISDNINLLGWSHYEYVVECFFFLVPIWLSNLPLEPLRRGDLLNAINKLAGERGSAKHPLLRRPTALSQGFNINGSTLWPIYNLHIHTLVFFSAQSGCSLSLPQSPTQCNLRANMANPLVLFFFHVSCTQPIYIPYAFFYR